MSKILELQEQLDCLYRECNNMTDSNINQAEKINQLTQDYDTLYTMYLNEEHTIISKIQNLPNQIGTDLIIRYLLRLNKLLTDDFTIKNLATVVKAVKNYNT